MSSQRAERNSLPDDPVTALSYRRSVLLPGLMLNALCSPAAPAAVIFSSYTPPANFSGFSSANGGLASQIAVSQTTVINGISIYNQMRSTGSVKFLILGIPSNTILYQSAPLSFSTEQAFSWKDSPPLSFTLQAGSQYWIGYVHSVGVNDMGESIRESQNGIRSVGNTASIEGYASPAFSHVVFSGSDAPLRLHVVPEPAPVLLSAAACLALSLRRRRLASFAGASFNVTSSDNSPAPR